VLLKDRVAIVSGAGDGLGRAICRRFAAEGAKLVVGDRDQAAVDATLAAIQDDGGQAVGAVTDITDRAMCEDLVSLACETYGALHILVNDAYDGGDYQRFDTADLAAWRATADVNVWGTLGLTQAALPRLKAAGDGRVVMICTHGVDVIQPTFGAYTGSKAALGHLTQVLASELGSDGVRVNAVYPGPMLGPGLRSYLEAEARRRGVGRDEVEREWAAKNALKYLLTPADVAGAVVFFASDLARSITGQALYVNGGESFH
jgi:NAD(P)-dependent dehydrogenase (short-subunit alcohol dehydrogenase family)